MSQKVIATVALAAIALIAWALPADAQPIAAITRIGYLSPTTRPEGQEVFRQELRRLGYDVGKTVRIEHRSAQGDFQRLPELAAELVALDVSVIVAERTQASLAAKQATATIPIVMVGVGDPVAGGLISSLSRPGGNVTGTISISVEVVGKQLEVLHELLPGASRVAVLWNPANPVFQQQLLNEAKASAAKLRIRLELVEASTPVGIDRAFGAISKSKPHALLVLGDPVFVSNAERIAGLALEHRIPTVGAVRALAEAGVVATYGFEVFDDFRRAAAYVDRILKGARPAELPVERSTRLELAINAKTARSLGIAVPNALAARADHVID